RGYAPTGQLWHAVPWCEPPKRHPPRRSLAWASVLSSEVELLRPVEAVAGVAESRDDEAALVQSAVDGGAHDVHVPMLPVHFLDPRRGGDDAHQRHRLGARL